MISLVAKIISLFATSLQTILQLASFTGKLIVAAGSCVSSLIIRTTKSIILFFQIVYEDNLPVFTEEIPASANGIIDTFVNQLKDVKDGVVDIYNEIFAKFCGLITTTNWLLIAVVKVLVEVLIVLKSSVIFVGDTVWFLVTFVPIHLPQLLRAVFMYVGHIIENGIINAYMTLLQFSNYLTEVPLQSFMGITCAIIIVHLIVHFRETITVHMAMLYWSLIRNVFYLYYTLINYFTNSEVGIITQMAATQDLHSREVGLSSSARDDAASLSDALCIICQEQQKCVLTLPCRHVCLCIDCCRRLYGYQRTCPICRTFIYHTVTVYL
uniref:RING-type domain-containing protein n=1 Tax=Heliothis virescens TaxID=7102 RepID=A0A2A4J122_HELVI